MNETACILTPEPEELMSGLFRIEIPLSGSPLKSINSYVFPSSTGSLIVDTGMRRDECREAFYSGLEMLGVDVSRTKVLATHLHADHLGLVGELAERGARIFLSAADGAVLEGFASPEGFVERLKEQGRSFGLDPAEIEKAVTRHPGLRYSPEVYPKMEEPPSVFEINGYSLYPVETPGHTPGHICLWAPAKRFLLSGDHILGDISPNITRWPGVRDSLGDYLSSLEKILGLRPRLALPGHRTRIEDVAGRIGELQRHHQQRMEEVREILSKGPHTVAEVAAEMTWDLRVDDWSAFPPAQKWFACGEAAAHLDHLGERARTEGNPPRWRLS